MHDAPNSALCRHCGEPLPPRPADKRGRPAVTHSGECQRLYKNRRNLEYRIERYRDATRPLYADRSDGELPFAATQWDPDEVFDESGQWDGFDVDRPFDPDYVHGQLLVTLVEAWEASRRAEKTLRASLAEFLESVPPETAARVRATLSHLPPEEYEALVRRRRARMSPDYLRARRAE